MIKGLRMRPRSGARLEGRLHDRLEELHRQVLPSLGEGGVGHRNAGQLFDMLGEGTRAGGRMEDQAHEELPRREFGDPAGGRAALRKRAADEGGGHAFAEKGLKVRPRRS